MTNIYSLTYGSYEKIEGLTIIEDKNIIL